jgi:hypothetical protein
VLRVALAPKCCEVGHLWLRSDRRSSMAARFRGLHGLDQGNAPLWRFPGSGQNFAGRVTIEPSVMQHSKALASVWKATYVLGDSGPSMKEQMPVLATWTFSSLPVECLCLRSGIATHCPAVPTALRFSPKALAPGCG